MGFSSGDPSLHLSPLPACWGVLPSCEIIDSGQLIDMVIAKQFVYFCAPLSSGTPNDHVKQLWCVTEQFVPWWRKTSLKHLPRTSPRGWVYLCQNQQSRLYQSKYRGYRTCYSLMFKNRKTRKRSLEFWNNLLWTDVTNDYSLRNFSLVPHLQLCIINCRSVSIMGPKCIVVLQSLKLHTHTYIYKRT